MSEEGQTESLARESQKARRELRRLRNTASFRIGLHLTRSISNPLRLLILPISFPIYCLILGLERIGKIAKPEIVENYALEEEQNHSIVLFPTNGVGFGHFTRLYAVAKQLRKVDENLEIIFFTPMPTLHVPYSDNFPTYHLAGRYKHSDMSASKWNAALEEMLRLVFEIHKPKWFIFDGAYPYRGMLNAINSQSATKMWLRRGTFKKGTNIPVDSIGFFDKIIHPKDSVIQNFENKIHQIDTQIVEPISMINKDEMISRDKVRRRFNIPLDCFVVYVQLGAGRINEIDSDIRIVVDTILDNPSAHIVLGESMLGERLDLEFERLTVIRDYPNSIYFNGFDMSVQAGGYNSYHEMKIMNMPTIFIPNQNTGMDDQLARCKVAEDEGWGIVIKSVTKQKINEAIERLSGLKPIVTDFDNGASAIARIILGGSR